MSSPLANVADLTLMRAQAQVLMPESWSLVHPTDVNDAQGSSQVWNVAASGTLAAGTGGRLMPAGYQAAEQVQASRPGAAQAWTITLPAGTAVYPQDRVIIGTALALAAVVASFAAYRVFEVTGAVMNHTAAAATRVAALEIT